ncbi:MAG: hypothetical protein V4507_10750 [Verrucomicrobiota bacterium]
MKTNFEDSLLESFLEEYFFQELDQNITSKETRLYRHLSGKIDLLPEIQKKFSFDQMMAKSLIEHAHQQTK